MRGFVFSCLMVAMSALSACVQHYQENYTGYSASGVAGFVQPTDDSVWLEEATYSIDDYQNVIIEKAAQGHYFLGHASFVSGDGRDLRDAKSMAMTVGADLLVLSYQFDHNGERGYYRKRVVQKTDGRVFWRETEILDIGLPLDYYQVDALFFSKVDAAKMPLGVLTNDALQARYGNQTGAVITAIFPGTVAAASDIAVGDIITAVNDRPIRSAMDFGRELHAVRGQTIEISLRRRGAPFDRRFTLGEGLGNLILVAGP
ncbi:MAG: PDZ domain-containing protein [Alphaproteobacteria bacterium]